MSKTSPSKVTHTNLTINRLQIPTNSSFFQGKSISIRRLNSWSPIRRDSFSWGVFNCRPVFSSSSSSASSSPFSLLYSPPFSRPFLQSQKVCKWTLPQRVIPPFPLNGGTRLYVPSYARKRRSKAGSTYPRVVIVTMVYQKAAGMLMKVVLGTALSA